MSTTLATAPPEVPEGTSLARLFRHALVYSLVPILQRAIGFLLIPLFTWKLNPAQWGVQQMTDLLVVAATQAAGLNLLAAMVRYYFDEQEERGRAEVIRSAILALGLFSSLLAGLALLLREPLAALLFERGDPELAGVDLVLCLSIALATIPFALASEAGFRYLVVRERPGVYTAIRTAKVAFELGLKIWMVVFLDWGVAGFLLSVLIGEVATTLGLTGSILARLGVRISWPKLAPMVAYAAPLVPVGLLQVGLHQIDRFMLKELAPLTVAMTWVGIFGLGYQVGFMVQQMGMGSFQQAWQPLIFGVQDGAERARIQKRVNTYSMLFVGAASAVLILFHREIIYFLSGQPSYYPAGRVLPWIACAYAFYGLYSLGQVTLLVEKRTLPLLWINLAALALNVALDVVLIPATGFVGPAIAKLATFALLALLVLHAGRDGDGAVPVDGGRVALVLGLVLAATVFAVASSELAALQRLGTLARLVLQTGALLAILAALRFWVLRREERELLQRKLCAVPGLGRLFAAP